MRSRRVTAGQHGKRPWTVQYFLILRHLECANDPVRVRIVARPVVESLCFRTVSVPGGLLEPLLFSLFVGSRMGLGRGWGPLMLSRGSSWLPLQELANTGSLTLTYDELLIVAKRDQPSLAAERRYLSHMLNID